LEAKDQVFQQGLSILHPFYVIHAYQDMISSAKFPTYSLQKTVAHLLKTYPNVRALGISNMAQSDPIPNPPIMKILGSKNVSPNTNSEKCMPHRFENEGSPKKADINNTPTPSSLVV